MPKKMRMTAIPLAKRTGSITGGGGDSVVVACGHGVSSVSVPMRRLVAQRSPSAGGRGYEREGVSRAIIRPLLEIALDLRHLVGDKGKADDRLAASLGEGIQPGHLHLDRFQPFGSGRIERGAGLPEWRIGGPGLTANRLDPGTLELLEHRGKQLGVTVGVAARWEIGVAGALTAPRAVDEDRSGQGHGRIELAGRGDTHE